MKTLIVIPARYGSERFPGKPLVDIVGRSMVLRTVDAALQAAENLDGEVKVFVATDDVRIFDHCHENGVEAVITSADAVSGTDRVFMAVKTLANMSDVIVNLQGDAPYTPPDLIVKTVEALNQSSAGVSTPLVRMTWDALDRLREDKKTTPFSGTTCIVNSKHEAIWFSKNITPGIRKEASLRETSGFSPVFRHVGLYAYTVEALSKFVAWPASRYEVLEGLEQLRFLENGFSIQTVEVDEPEVSISGIDTPEDLSRLIAILKNKEIS